MDFQEGIRFCPGPGSTHKWGPKLQEVPHSFKTEGGVEVSKFAKRTGKILSCESAQFYNVPMYFEFMEIDKYGN